MEFHNFPPRTHHFVNHILGCPFETSLNCRHRPQLSRTFTLPCVSKPWLVFRGVGATASFVRWWTTSISCWGVLLSFGAKGGLEVGVCEDDDEDKEGLLLWVGASKSDFDKFVVLSFSLFPCRVIRNFLRDSRSTYTSK